MRTALSAAIVLLVFAASMLLQTNAQEFVEKTCEEAFGSQQNWPSWVPHCLHNGTCMLYFPTEDDPYPFPYCVCEPPYTGMTCETFDWDSGSYSVAQAGFGFILLIVLGFILFDFLVIISIIYCRSKKKPVNTHRHNETTSVDQNDNEMQLTQEADAPTQAAPTETTSTDIHERPRTGRSDPTDVDSAVEDQVPRRAHTAEHATPLQQLPPARAASVRASALLPPHEVYYIDEANEDGMDSEQPMLAANNN